MPTYKSEALLSERSREWASVLMNVVEHAAPMGFTITALSLDAGQLAITIEKTLTRAEREHLGLA